MIVVAGSARVKSDALPGLLAHATTMAADSRGESGCLEYRFSVDIDDPTVVRLFECWEDQDALDRHFATEHFAAFGAAITDGLDGPADFQRYDVTNIGPLFG